MDRLRLLVVALAVVVVIESAFISFPLVQSLGSRPVQYKAGSPETHSFQFGLFNQPISNDTEQELKSSLNGSWLVTVQNTLLASSPSRSMEAQIAFAPPYPSENLSIPTIIVQERADGLLRVEYYAQSWPNSFGLVLYNSTSQSWSGGTNVTLRFVSFGQPSAINPSIAPRPNGNLTITVGGTTVVSDYPIAWASLADFYLYGLPGSSYLGGNLTLTVQSLTRS
ncbi:MAG: hypothetical protein LYZ69_06705 [Nitrososphaerales archaeon]|nr:hypothetical protein [Nitrososphaerales archaeon]